MKKILKNNLKVVVAFILGIIVCGVTVYAIDASNITYNEQPLDTVIDDLYSRILSGNSNIELKYGDFQQLGNYSTTTKQYTFTAETAGKIVVAMQATGSNSGVTNRTTRYVKINGESVQLTNVVADDWQFGTYYVGSVPANATVQSYISNAASGSLNTAGLFVFFIHD